MTRWLAIFLCSIALCCSGALAFAQGLGAPQAALQVLPDEMPAASDAEPGSPAEQAQPDTPFDVPELFDQRLPALPSNSGIASALLHATALRSPPFIEGPQRPPRGFSVA